MKEEQGMKDPNNLFIFAVNSIYLKYLKLIRVHQWIKNLFVFIPIFFSGKFADTHLLFLSFIGFLIFSFTASSIYIVNDYIDIEADRSHPEKKNRPLASGEVSKTEAIVLFSLLTLAVAVLLTFFGNMQVIVIISAYFLLNLAYSLKLKHVPIIDISIISVGFLFRVLLGGFITAILVSDWTILLTFTLALILALGKRRGELINAGLSGKTRKALDGYNLEFLNISIAVACTITIVCYVMYILTPEVQERMHKNIFYTFIFVFIGILRYLQQTLVYGKTESPTSMIFKDIFLQITLILWGISFLLLIYFK